MPSVLFISKGFHYLAEEAFQTEKSFKIMNCPVCNRNLAPTLSICPSCGTMIKDSVREELVGKISNIAKPFDFELKGNKMTQDILLVGTGALATLFAARLSEAGHSVSMLGTWKQGLHAAPSIWGWWSASWWRAMISFCTSEAPS